MSLTCPFGRAVVNLANVHLPWAQKMWFVNMVQAGQKTSGQLAQKYNLNSRSIRAWVQTHKQGKTIAELLIVALLSSKMYVHWACVEMGHLPFCEKPA
jgi:hypothetical protein